MIKFYTTVLNIARTALKIDCVKRTAMKTFKKLVGDLRSKTVRCGNAYSNVHTKNVFVAGVPGNIDIAKRMPWIRKQDVYLLYTARYTVTVLEQARQVPNSRVALVQRNRF